MIKLKKLSKLPFKRLRDNASAYELYVLSHGEKALKRFPSSLSFLKKPGWYSKVLGENRYFIQDSSSKSIGVVSYSANWVMDFSKNKLMYKEPFRKSSYWNELPSVSKLPIFSKLSGLVRFAEVGIVVEPSAQKKGSAALAVDLIFKELKKKGVDFAFSRTSSSNISAIKLMEKTGWVRLPQQQKNHIYFFKKV